MKKMSKIIFMGTPEFAVPALKALYDFGHEIMLVITQPDKLKGRGKKVSKTPVKIMAEELELNIYQPEKVNSEESVDIIKSLEADYIIVVAYGQILKKEILESPKKDCLNIHASLLPKYRGAAPINWVLINGENKTGITIMKMEEGLDTGPMYYKRVVEIDEEITAGQLHDKLMYVGADSILEALKCLNDGSLFAEKQNHSESSYAAMLDKKMSKIDWNNSSKNIHNLIRGLDPWPGSSINYKNNIIKIFNTNYIVDSEGHLPGTILSADENGIRIASSDGYVIVREIQMPGKKRMDVKSFLIGNEIEIGYRIGEDTNVL
jgi:methionyl-tRNA formyltransferase